jgi:hypothetical protein
MPERRKEQRWRAYIGGRVSFFHGQSTADVLVRDTSTSGAKLVVHNGRFIPDQFDLIVPQWQTVMRATARWRRQDQIGIEFERLNKNEAPIPISLAWRLKQLESKSAELKHRIAELSE